nr:hypothetical protein [Tanacetum cinerariifolium]GFA26122.1 hypothetical protein [Tanacetum cinerariifolium]
QLDWNNPEGQQYPHDLRKPLPLIPTSRGRRVIPFDHFINKDLEYLRGGVSIRKYTTLVMKSKAAYYGHIKWIKDLVPREHASASIPSETATEGAGRSTTGSQSRQQSASEFAFAEEPVQTTCQMEEPPHPVFEIGADDQPIVQTSQHPEWFSQPRRQPLPDRAWNTTLPATQGDDQSWISDLARQTNACSSFNELLDTPIDFSNFIMHRLNVDTLTPDLLAGPTYNLMRGSCTSLSELEYHLEEPLPLIPDNRGRRVIPFEHFINNDLEYLRGGASSRKYTTFVTKMKAADYGHIKWIEDLVPRTMWIQQPIDYNSDGTLYDVRNALDDCLKGIRMQYFPTTIWRRGDKARAAAMIQAIDKMLKTRRVMRSLERFVGGRQYGGDFRMLQRTI